MKEKMIAFTNFNFKYNAQSEPTLKSIDLTIYQGEKVLIVGPSGSGKSTLGQCLNGQIPAIFPGEMTGSLEIAGKKAFEMSIYEKSLLVSTVLQDTDGQFIGLSVAEDLAFALENDAVPQAEMKSRVADWGNRLELSDLLLHRPQDLSGGQKQRVSMAGVLIDESPILLFDEPLANLDPKSGQDTIELIDHLHKEVGATTLIIEHRLEDVLHCPVDRIILMYEGQIVFNGNPAELLATDLLTQYGIREPLYLSCLHALGCDKMPLSDVASLSKDAASWSLPAFEEKPHFREPLVELRQISFSYPNRQVLQGIDLTIYKGERLAIVGKNGAGKSTLAKILCQFLQPKGEILWRGASIVEDSIKERAERIGYVLQNPNQMISQTLLFDEVALGLRLRGVLEDEITERVEDVLRVCGLHPFRKWPISALSFGQKKRATIASILVLNPEVILLDEPTAGQDERHYTEMMNFLDTLNKKGHTIVMITHDMQLMLDYSDRTLVLVDGQIIADASPATVLTNCKIVEQANLKETSIFQLAKNVGVSPLDLTAYYMKKGRRV